MRRLYRFSDWPLAIKLIASMVALSVIALVASAVVTNILTSRELDQAVDTDYTALAVLQGVVEREGPFVLGLDVLVVRADEHQRDNGQLVERLAPALADAGVVVRAPPLLVRADLAAAAARQPHGRRQARPQGRSGFPQRPEHVSLRSGG